MTTGFLYILINSAMPGLAKVGKTTRTPQERLLELSSATGVPSPFILAYQQPVANCHAAEAWVHTELGRRGYRLSENREFFNAPLHEIVAVLAASIAVEDEYDSLSIPTASVETAFGNANTLAVELATLADGFRDGDRDVLLNLSRALELYEQAAKLGDVYACEQAARLLRDGGPGIKSNVEKSLSYLKKALALDQVNNWSIASEIAELYSEQNQPQSGLAYWKLFAEKIDDKTSDYQVGRLWRYCFDVVTYGLAPEIDQKVLGQHGPALIDSLNAALSRGKINPIQAEATKNFIVDCVGKTWQ